VQDATPSIWFSIGAARFGASPWNTHTHSRAVFRNILIPDTMRDLLYTMRVCECLRLLFILCTHFFKEAAACREKSRSN
jgi:hypothetical protein